MPTEPNTLAGLLVEEGQADILDAGLALATAVGLPVTSWQPGDPTRSLYMLEALILEKMEVVATGYVQSGFLDYAQGQWLTLVAKQNFNVDVPSATFATTAVTLTNAGGGVYILAAGDLTLKCSVTGATYHNTTGGTLNGPGTLSVTVQADAAGSASSAGAGEIDTLVTTLLGVTCSNPAAAIGSDVQDPATTVAQCRDKLGSLSPNGPSAAYSYVARNPALTGVNTVTRCRVYPDSETGDVTIYIAGDSGALGGSDVAAVQAAILTWATPLCITPTTISATPATVAVTYTLWLYASVNKTAAQVQTDVSAALQALFKSRPIGGDGDFSPPAQGALYKTLIESTIGSVYPGQTFDVLVTSPVIDVPLGNGSVAQLGTVTGAINIVPNPK